MLSSPIFPPTHLPPLPLPRLHLPSPNFTSSLPRLRLPSPNFSSSFPRLPSPNFSSSLPRLHIPSPNFTSSLPHLHLPLERKKRRKPPVPHLPPDTIQKILTELVDVKQEQEDFQLFLQVVLTDIQTKAEHWKMVTKNRESSEGITSKEGKASKDLRRFAAIQVFMLARYQGRISVFQKAAAESLLGICWEHKRGGEEIQSLVARHHRVLLKMRRRLKHMMDVSDRYFLVDMMETLDLLGTPTSHLETRSTSKSLGTSDSSNCQSYLSCSYSSSRSFSFRSFSTSSSMDSLGSLSPLPISWSSPSLSLFPSPSPSPFFSPIQSSPSPFPSPPYPEIPLQPWRSLLDQMLVLTRTYTQRGE